MDCDERAMSSHLHIDTDRLELYILGRSDPQSRQAVEQHLNKCALCRGRSLEAARLITCIREAMLSLVNENADIRHPDTDTWSAQGSATLFEHHLGGGLCSWWT